jgi:hypothetical protein
MIVFVFTVLAAGAANGSQKGSLMTDTFFISGAVIAASVTILIALVTAFSSKTRRKKSGSMGGSIMVENADGSVLKIANLDKSEVEDIVTRFRDRVQSGSH